MLNRSPLFRLGIASLLPMTLAATAAMAAREQPVTIVGHHADEAAMTELVSYADLDLATDSGASRLARRVDYAARDVCAPYDFDSIRFDASIPCAASARSAAAPRVEEAIASARQLALSGGSGVAPTAVIAVTAFAN